MEKQQIASLKKLLIAHLRSQLEQKAEMARQGVDSATEARNAETKSSAGDKYETGRELMQREIDKQQHQLQQANQMLKELEKAETSRAADKAGYGSLVISSAGYWFLALGLGQVKVQGQTFLCVSLASPAGKALLGKSAGDTADLPGRQITIHALN